jgi:hypothetical protein
LSRVGSKEHNEQLWKGSPERLQEDWIEDWTNSSGGASSELKLISVPACDSEVLNEIGIRM